MPDPTSFLETAASIGARLIGEAIWHEDRCNWLGDSMEYVDHGWRVVHKACGVSLYDGTSGIALFLARLYRATGDPLLRTTAIGALRHTFRNSGDLPPTGRLGLYSGLPGIAYAAMEAGRAMDSDEWSSRGDAVLSTLTLESDDGDGLDVIGGAAGTIPLLLRVGQDRARELAFSLGERLLLRAERVNGTASWSTIPTPDGRNLTGYSHGAAGIALALLELGTVTNDGRFLSMARAGIEYERHLFDPRQGNWPDLRSPTQDSTGAASYGMAWCHGAPGIGLARLRSFALSGEPGARAEAEIALATTRRAVEQITRGALIDFSPCHGLSGMAELFLTAESVLKDSSWVEVAEQVGALGVERIGRARLPWPCGVPNGSETPALLTGLAGIGHFYLRLTEKEKVPSVLLLMDEVPRERSLKA